MQHRVVPSSEISSKTLRARDYLKRDMRLARIGKTRGSSRKRVPDPVILNVMYRLPGEDHLNRIAAEMHKTAKAKGWWKGKNGDLKGKLLLVHSEISEAVEEFRAGYPLNEVRFELDKHGQWKPEGFPIEVADAIIRLGDICAKHNIDIDKAIDMKRAFNEGRPYLHGGKAF